MWLIVILSGVNLRIDLADNAQYMIFVRHKMQWKLQCFVNNYHRSKYFWIDWFFFKETLSCLEKLLGCMYRCYSIYVGFCARVKGFHPNVTIITRTLCCSSRCHKNRLFYKKRTANFKNISKRNNFSLTSSMAFPRRDFIGNCWIAKRNPNTSSRKTCFFWSL